jgi:hypothetical protein
MFYKKRAQLKNTQILIVKNNITTNYTNSYQLIRGN